MAVTEETKDALADAAADLIRTVPERFALFLDLDGTLVDIASKPHLVVVPPTLVRDLMHLSERLEGAVAILTGRPLTETDKFLAPLKLPGAGVHGAEVRLECDGAIVPRIDAFPADVRDEVVRALERVTGTGLIVEHKSASVAVHVRAVPDHEGEIARIIEGIVAKREVALRVERGRRVIEILPQAISKGRGLVDLARALPFLGRRPVVIGDDVSDEAAFAVAREAGGFALPVAGERFSADAAAFTSPEEVRIWLSKLSLHQARLS